MISKLSSKLTDRLFFNQSISEEERELYVYGFYMMLSHITYLILAFAFGLIFGCGIESIFFYIAFQFIRRTAGGYHASTETRCQILSAMSIFVVIVFMKISKVYSFDFPLILLTFLSAVVIFFLSPLDTPEKPLSKKEFKYFRKKSRVILLMIFSVIVVSYFLKLDFLFTPFSTSLILENILLVFGKIKKPR